MTLFFPFWCLPYQLSDKVLKMTKFFSIKVRMCFVHSEVLSDVKNVFETTFLFTLPVP